MRRLTGLLLGVSLVLAVAAAGLWVRSYFAHDVVMVYRGPSATALHASRGQVLLVRGRTERDIGDVTRWHRGPSMPLRGPNVRRALDEVHAARIVNDRLSGVPHWLVFAVTALPLVIVGTAIIRRRRRLRWAGTPDTEQSAEPNIR